MIGELSLIIPQFFSGPNSHLGEADEGEETASPMEAEDGGIGDPGEGFKGVVGTTDKTESVPSYR